MGSVSKRASYVEFKVERPSDIDVASSDDEDNTMTLPEKPKQRWTCGLRLLTTSSSTAPTPTTKIEFKVSFTVQGVHSFCLRIKPNSGIETHNILHGSETHRSVTLQELGQSGSPTWRTQIASALSGTIPDQLMDSMAWKLQRDLSSLPLPKWSGRVAGRTRIIVFHVHVPVKVVTPDGVTAGTLLNRVSAPLTTWRMEGNDEDCVICLEGLQVQRGLPVRRILVCSHVFHGDCLLSWLLKRASCPVCWSRCLGLFFPVCRQNPQIKFPSEKLQAVLSS